MEELTPEVVEEVELTTIQIIKEVTVVQVSLSLDIKRNKMAHFAQINEKNIVQQILVVPDEQQHRGNDYLSIDLGLGGVWVQTSYNGNIRKMFAGVGYSYNSELDIFLPPKPFNSWVLNETKGEWEAPIPRPEVESGMVTIWNEDNQEWGVEELPTIEGYDYN
jgi:hypothetical protein